MFVKIPGPLNEFIQCKLDLMRDCEAFCQTDVCEISFKLVKRPIIVFVLVSIVAIGCSVGFMSIMFPPIFSSVYTFMLYSVMFFQSIVVCIPSLFCYNTCLNLDDTPIAACITTSSLDLRSQATLGPVSSWMGDSVRLSGVYCCWESCAS